MPVARVVSWGGTGEKKQTRAVAAATPLLGLVAARAHRQKPGRPRGRRRRGTTVLLSFSLLVSPSVFLPSWWLAGGSSGRFRGVADRILCPPAWIRWIRRSAVRRRLGFAPGFGPPFADGRLVAATCSRLPSLCTCGGGCSGGGSSSGAAGRNFGDMSGSACKAKGQQPQTCTHPRRSPRGRRPNRHRSTSPLSEGVAGSPFGSRPAAARLAGTGLVGWGGTAQGGLSQRHARAAAAGSDPAVGGPDLPASDLPPPTHPGKTDGVESGRATVAVRVKDGGRSGGPGAGQRDRTQR